MIFFFFFLDILYRSSQHAPLIQLIFTMHTVNKLVLLVDWFMIAFSFHICFNFHSYTIYLYICYQQWYWSLIVLSIFIFRKICLWAIQTGLCNINSLVFCVISGNALKLKIEFTVTTNINCFNKTFQVIQKSMICLRNWKLESLMTSFIILRHCTTSW